MNIKTELYHKYPENSPRAIFTDNLLLLLDNETIDYSKMSMQSKRLLRLHGNPKYFPELMQSIICNHCENITIINDSMLGVYTYDLVQEIEETITLLFALTDDSRHFVKNGMINTMLQSICWDNVTLHYYNQFIENFNYLANQE